MANFHLLILVYFLQIVFSFLGFLMLLFQIIRRPFSFYKTKSRNVPPACLSDPSHGTHEYITANGIKFHCVSKGDPSKPLMLFVHGFPEFWFSWQYQLKEFCNDYRVVAIDMRGYGETDKPAGVRNYTIEILKEDIVQLIKVLSPDRKCILVAHDWGGVVSWRVVQNHPELFHKFIVMNCPHAKVYRRAITKGWKQTLKSWYIFFFQCPWIPEMLLAINDYAAFDDMFKKGLFLNKDFSDDMVEAFKYTFSPRRNLTPPINYYRCMFMSSNRKHSYSSQKIETPTLLIWGERDLALDMSLSDKKEYNDICTDITIKRIPGCSHFVQQDCPHLTNQHMREFLEQ
ncbi:PREDICTED: epoxide hydrolase 4-like [Amphimedon queenslandica]|uniref:AB hydrolase-1 domain-containing protein n=1 Tax=Amphimedon queenslandica TaxID=400682 RepID=A0A1X7U8B3_AMPQE|nr:PREDICTED: epoxide hydrolase 4-like [Amphimedon queenslandica]|eukprot:XP_011405812.1 PREDICTED: epoxide hydrolase 4-like [Amphimedon queenslandica]